MAQALYRIYRPATFADVVGQEPVATTIQNQFRTGHLAHAYVFTGPRGIGKTTMARLVAKLANCEQPKDAEPCNACEACREIASGTSLDVFEIDAASNTDVENVRENIIKSVRFAPNRLKKKVFIIDEVHMLSTSAFNALLKTLEEPPEHVLFVLATTEIHKVPETIISRCQRFDFRRILPEVLLKRLQYIVKQEHVDVETDVLEQIVKHSGGCARDAESLLGQVLALGDKKITMQEASLVLPASNEMMVKQFLDLLYQKNAAGAVSDLNTFLEQGVDLKVFMDDMLEALRARLFGPESVFVREALERFLEARAQIKTDHLPQLPIELAIVELCDPVLSSRATTPSAGEPRDLPEDFKYQGVDSDYVAPIIERPAERAEAISADSTVFDTIPIISLDEVRKKWPQVFEQIRECNASLPLFMQTCEVCGVNGEHVELGFGYDLYVQTVNKDKNRRVIEEAFERVLGRPMKVKAVVKKMAEDETVIQLIEQFGGSIG
ncbi:DNA polymerase III subunit gamma/tau [Candidatus Uhrbacteria bacterium]|nr:DNA polymerase III subunit gamma/tau [Candidatus Uhrbacteria bacterium]